jgi:hypothetical protein
MQKRSTAFAVAVAAALLATSRMVHAAAPSTQPVADVPVKEVVLFSSGVGYFEHFGTVQGDGSTELRFKTNQINDILKSLVLQDLDGGRVSAVTYPSQDPIAKTLKSFQVDITNNPPLADLLNQLRGSKVTLAINGEKTIGVILGVETKKKAIGDKGETVQESVLNLVSGGKILSQPLDAVNSIQLDDAALQDELNKALVALAGARDQDKKPVKISFTGAGERHVRLGYVVETPIWKTSYRLILGKSDDKAAAATRPTLADGKLQGWAIVENQTDNDWNNVQLSLVSGRPISFIENLYTPLYLPRPTVEPELFASLRPQMYADGMQAKQMLQPGGQAPGLIQQLRAARGGGGGGGGQSGGNLFNGDREVAAEAAAAPIMDPTASIASVASAASVGELFEYTVGSVTLPRQKSAMLPIITDPIDVERVSIYNQSVLPRNPLNGAKISNTTKKHLLAGPITVFDGATYAGDAQIDNLPPGQERLLSYGVDLQMLVDATKNASSSELQTGKIIKGALLLTSKYVNTQDYVAENKSDHEKVLIIEHPRRAGWELADTVSPVEKTDNAYRFRETVPAGKSVKLTVKEQVVQSQSIAILPADFGTVDFYRQQGAIPKPVQDALLKAIAMKQALVDTQRQIDVSKSHLSDITSEQSRIRDNLKAVKDTSQYYTHLMEKLSDQETDIEKTQKADADLQGQLEKQRTELERYLENLNVG